MSERATRVAEQLRGDLMEVFLRGRVRDPAVKDVVVTAVRVSPDLQHARVYVRTLQPLKPRKQERVVEGLERAAGFLRREIGKNLSIRRSPELVFYWDDAVDQGGRIERILMEIGDESAKAQQDGEDADEES